MSVRLRGRFAAATVVIVATLLWGSPTPAHAAPAITLGGGAGIVIDSAATAELCTLTSIGHDRAGLLVGLTAGHCGDRGAVVRSEREYDAGVLGTVVTSVQTGTSAAALDYAVIRFDPARVRASATYGRVVITGVAPAPGPGGVACKQGRTTGYRCGIVLPRLSPATVLLAACSQPGDSGGPIVVNNRVVGLVRGSVVRGGAGRYPACAGPVDAARSPTLATSILAVIADLDRRGPVGVGYRPV